MVTTFDTQLIADHDDRNDFYYTLIYRFYPDKIELN